MTTEQTALQRLKEVCEAATPDPWVMVSGNDADLRDMIFSKFKNRLVAQTAFAESRATGNFIAIARTAVPALIEYCEALENLLAVKDTGYAYSGAFREHVMLARARLEEVCPK